MTEPAAARPRGAGRDGSLWLVIAALLFGSTFLVVKDAVAVASPLAFLAARFALATAVLAPVAARRPSSPGELLHGALAGIALVGGYLMQTYGLRHTSSARSALLTYLLVVLVPLAEAVLLRRRPRAGAVAGAVVATAGLVILTAPAGGAHGFGPGEALSVGCAVCFAAHIVILGRVAGHHDPFRLTLVQLAVVAVVCLVPSLWGPTHFDGGVWLAVAYTGVVATAVAFVLMVHGQRSVTPSRAALLLLIEPVSAAVLGFVRGEPIGWHGAIGAVVVMVGIGLAERAHDPSPETASTVGAA